MKSSRRSISPGRKPFTTTRAASVDLTRTMRLVTAAAIQLRCQFELLAIHMPDERGAR